MGEVVVMVRLVMLEVVVMTTSGSGGNEKLVFQIQVGWYTDASK